MTTHPAPTCRDWPAGTRVRCVDDTNSPFGELVLNREYVISKIEHWSSSGRSYVYVEGNRVVGFRPDRFKPVCNDIDAICRGEWPAGTRVRCLRQTSDDRITVGADYTVKHTERDLVVVNETWGAFMRTRFKPVVRVPMGRAYDLTDLLRRAVAAFDAMSETQKADHRRKQRRSWVVGETILSHPEMSRADAEALYDRVCPYA